MVWMNERRDVKTYNVIQEARSAVVDVDANNPLETQNFNLVRVNGQSSTQAQLYDP
jgi:hypothetical protein